jgi:preprotein translocase subunit SecE
MINYFKGVVEELKLVTWLTADETARDTSYVILSALIFSAFLGAVGWLTSLIITWLMK